jgi:outer membrane receptor for ferrienterochelin and colicin
MAALWGALVALAPVSAWADARTEARRHFEAGMDLIAQARFTEGVAELEEAYEILPHPVVLYNIARALRDAGELERSLEYFRRYLDSDPEDRGEVEAAITNLEARIEQEKTKPPPPPPVQPGEQPPPPPPPKPPPPKPEPGAEPEPGDELGVYEERVVTASRREQSPLDSPNSIAIVTQQDIRLSGITRIPELLRRVAGMDVMQITGGDANVSMRGLNSRFSNKLLVLVNGRSVKNDILGSTFWETLSIDVDQIDRIEVLRGPGSSLYGADAFSGVVNIITIAPGETGPGFRAGVGDQAQTYVSLWASDRQGDFAYRASAGFTQYPRWTREVQDGRVDVATADVDQNLGARNARADVRTSNRVGKDMELQLGGGFARTDLDVYGIGPFNDYHVQFDNGDVSAAFVHPYIHVRTNYTYLGAEALANHDYIGHTLYKTDPRQHALEIDIVPQYAFDYPEELSHQLQGGVNYRLKSIDWNYLIDEPPIEHHIGFFAQYGLTIYDHFNIVGSGRIDYVPALETVVPSGRATFIIKPGESKRQAIKASVATAFRSPTFLESYLDIPIQLSLAGLELKSSSARADDPDFQLDAEHILAAELGYVNQLTDVFDVEVAAYYNRITDFIQLAQPRLVTLSDKAAGLSGIDPQTGRYNVGFGGWENSCAIENVFGGEVGGRVYPVDGLDIFANYGINYGLQELAEGCVIAEDQKTSHHKVNVGTQVRTPFGLDGEITFHWQSSQRWGEQVATLDGIELQLFDLPAYHLLNGRIGYSFLEKRAATVEITVFNALAGVFDDAPQMHPFGNRVGRRFMGFFSYRL